MIKEFERQGGGNEITDFFYKQKSLFEAQKFILLKKLKNESDFGNWLKIEKLLLSLIDKEIKFYTKIKPVDTKSPKPGKKLVKKIIRELAFDEMFFWMKDDLIRAIIKKTKCDVDTAQSIVLEMEKLGLNYSRALGSQNIVMFEFAKLCGYLSTEEISKIEQEKTRRREQTLKEEREHKKRILEYNKAFLEKFGHSKNWPDKTMEKYWREMP